MKPTFFNTYNCTLAPKKCTMVREQKIIQYIANMFNNIVTQHLCKSKDWLQLHVPPHCLLPPFKVHPTWNVNKRI